MTSAIGSDAIKNDNDPLEDSAVVICSSRRFVSLLSDQDKSVQATTSSKTLEIAVGDRVKYEAREGDNFITSIAKRRNELIRSYRKEQKVMASNLDLIFAVTAVGQSYNTLFIDRVLAVAHSQSIPCMLIVNKVDQGLEENRSSLDLYQSLGIQVCCVSAKFGVGLEEISNVIEAVDVQSAALIGVSGVGKSTLLNRFVPDARTRTQEVNERTGLGRQTTTQALAHIYRKKEGGRMFFVDMPGLQSFGVGHLSIEQIAESFPEIQSRVGMCEFSDCGHIRERVCAVRQAAEAGEIAATRYHSYIKMIEEVEADKEY